MYNTDAGKSVEGGVDSLFRGALPQTQRATCIGEPAVPMCAIDMRAPEFGIGMGGAVMAACGQV